ncbi:TadE/TadG family type IV pilus assembly protein [Rhodopseudomonas palustris]|uniref:TadE/TadG family type IV pilus assembly protein n=1 Tax=Rhodopseudomonas palustris TaxID=1076 RepID=UPI000E5AA40C|nr:TadE/TadG family type IV pilus assembly protein [Rhodopseudomonas palustris]QLH73220.1 pilus assembly protein [Rhodopseudomonas palustris]RIA00358.1 pilus assembly protein [Rhodopseudomonas palustris]
MKPRFLRDRSANVAVIFAIALIPLLGAVGSAVDYTIASNQRMKMQTALDSAVLAGVLEPTDAAKIARANAAFTANFQPSWSAATASFTVNGGELSGSANSTVPTQFLGVLGIKTMTIAAQSAAVATSKRKVCILLTASPDAQAFLVNSGAKLTGPTCEIHVASTAGVAGMINSGTTLDVGKVCIKGSATQNGGPYPVASTGCAAIANPFVGALPPVSAPGCSFTNQTYSAGNVTLSPGTYCGSTNFNGSGTLTLRPGLYVIKNGAMIFNSGWTVSGTGVTFYLADQNATLTFNGNVTAKLSAPSSGSYADILMFEPDGLNRTNLPINGTAGSSWTGMMYLPSRDVTINSVSNVVADSVTMVFATLTLNATNWSIQPSPSAPAATLTGARLSR